MEKPEHNSNIDFRLFCKENFSPALSKLYQLERRSKVVA